MPDENLPATAGGPVPPAGPQPRSVHAGAGQAPGGTGPTRGHAGERDGVVNGDSAPIVVGPVDAMTHEYEMPPSPAAGWRDRAPDATGDDPAPDDRWPDEELIPERPPIASHRRLTGRHGSRIGATILGLLLAAAVGTIALRGWAASGSPDAGDQPLPYPADTVPAGPALLPDESLGAPTASPSPDGSPSMTKPATSPTAGPTQPVPGAGPGTPAPTHTAATGPVAPAGGLTVVVVNQGSGKGFGPAQDSTADGAPIVQRTGSGAGEQWRLTAVSGSCYQLVNVRTGKALDDPQGGDATAIQQWSFAPGNVNQTWCFQATDNGYAIRNLAGGCLLQLRGGATGDGTPIQQSCSGTTLGSDLTWRLIATT